MNKVKLISVVVIVVMIGLYIKKSVDIIKNDIQEYRAESKCVMANITAHHRNEMYTKDGQCFLKANNKLLTK